MTDETEVYEKFHHLTGNNKIINLSNSFVDPQSAVLTFLAVPVENITVELVVDRLNISYLDYEGLVNISIFASDPENISEWTITLNISNSSAPIIIEEKNASIGSTNNVTNQTNNSTNRIYFSTR